MTDDDKVKLNGSGHHLPDVLDDEDEDPLSAEETIDAPSPAAELAASCARFVLSKYKVGLDYSPDTLSLVDQYLRDARQEIAVRPEALDLIGAAAGAYLGEVVRRRFGGYWRAEGDYSTWRVLLSRVFLSFNPVGMAREALVMRDEEGWHAHFETDPGEREIVERRLQALPEVPEDEYFAPSTRFDVVNLAFDALRANMRDNGTSDVRFTPDDYD